jgi:transposase
MRCWRRLREWNEAGVWQRLRELLPAELRAADMLDFFRAAVDASHPRLRDHLLATTEDLVLIPVLARAGAA